MIHIDWWWAPTEGLNLMGNLVRYAIVIGLFLGLLFFSYNYVFKPIVKKPKNWTEIIGSILIGAIILLWFLASLKLFGFISPDFGFINEFPDEKGLCLILYPIVAVVLFCILYHYVIKPVLKKLLTHKT